MFFQTQLKLIFPLLQIPPPGTPYPTHGEALENFNKVLGDGLSYFNQPSNMTDTRLETFYPPVPALLLMVGG
jgi:hypothetical protein